MCTEFALRRVERMSSEVAIGELVGVIFLFSRQLLHRVIAVVTSSRYVYQRALTVALV